MKIKWLGHSSFLVTSRGGTRIITDPYQVGGIINYGAVDVEADIVVVSHEHRDHNYVAGVKGNPEIIRSLGSSTAKGVNFHGIATFHDKSQGKERGTNTIFLLTLDDIRICHLGDLGHSLSEEQLGEIGKVDILMLPVGGPAATIDLPEVETLCQQLSPRVILPMHYKNNKCSFPRYGVEDFLKGKEKVRKMNSSEVVLELGQLPAPSEIIVLEPEL